MITVRVLICIAAVIGCLTVVTKLMLSLINDTSMYLNVMDYIVAMVLCLSFAVKFMGETLDIFYPIPKERE